MEVQVYTLKSGKSHLIDTYTGQTLCGRKAQGTPKNYITLNGVTAKATVADAAYTPSHRDLCCDCADYVIDGPLGPDEFQWVDQEATISRAEESERRSHLWAVDYRRTTAAKMLDEAAHRYERLAEELHLQADYAREATTAGEMTSIASNVMHEERWAVANAGLDYIISRASEFAENIHAFDTAYPDRNLFDDLAAYLAEKER